MISLASTGLTFQRQLSSAGEVFRMEPARPVKDWRFGGRGANGADREFVRVGGGTGDRGAGAEWGSLSGCAVGREQSINGEQSNRGVVFVAGDGEHRLAVNADDVLPRLAGSSPRQWRRGCAQTSAEASKQNA